MSRRVASARAPNIRSKSGGAICMDTTIRLYLVPVKGEIAARGSDVPAGRDARGSGAKGARRRRAAAVVRPSTAAVRRRTRGHVLDADLAGLPVHFSGWRGREAGPGVQTRGAIECDSASR